MQKDSVVQTLLVATILCIVCSVLVSGAAVVLKSRQDVNKQLDIKKNLLLASGLIQSGSLSQEEIEKAYEQIKAEVVDLETGDVVEGVNPESFDQRKARKDNSRNKVIAPEKDLAGMKTRARKSIVYKVMEGETAKMLILPIHGKGLWSTLYGFIALSSDTKVIKGIGFYEHGETPGLGGEIDNPLWKAKWKGKHAFDDDFDVRIGVVKGSVAASDNESMYKIDGLSGATITSNGVTGLVRYWLGEDGFGPYLQKFRQAETEN